MDEMSQHEWEAWRREVRERRSRIFWKCMVCLWASVAGALGTFVIPAMLRGLFPQSPDTSKPPPPVVVRMERSIPQGVSARAPRPERKTRIVRKLVRNYVGEITHRVTGYTRFSDPGDPWKRTYASVNFLPGSKRPDLYDENKPFKREWVVLQDKHYTVAVPYSHRYLFEERIETPSGHWYHRYLIWAEGYTPPGVYAVPRDRCTKKAFDFLFTSTKRGRTPTQRAYDWTNNHKTFEVYRLDWVTMEVTDGK
jgi:hypothetical protein